MNDNVKYETYIFVSNKKFLINVIQVNNLEIIYEEKNFLENDKALVDYEKLYDFLNNNIFKIEKQIGDFIKDIYLILELEEFFSIQISVKNENNGDILSPSSLSYSLNEAKEQCFNSNKEKIIHMIIDNYQIDNVNYSNLPKNIKCNNFSIDLRFICLPNSLVKNLEKIFKKYQISIKQILNIDYIESLFVDNNQNLSLKAKQVIEGLNRNEVKLESKTQKNSGFFEKFFNFFS